MKKFLLFLLLIVAVSAGVWFFLFRGKKNTHKGPKPVSMAVSKHSEAFNAAIESMLGNYYQMNEAFVNWDVNKANESAAALKQGLDSFSLKELEKDSVEIAQSASFFLDNARAEIQNIINQPDIAAKRTSLNSLSDALYMLMKTVRYDRSKLYLQECPMAFDENHSGYWLSATQEVRNPYLGTQHPQYKASMLNCGEPKDTVNFMQK